MEECDIGLGRVERQFELGGDVTIGGNGGWLEFVDGEAGESAGSDDKTCDITADALMEAGPSA